MFEGWEDFYLLVGSAAGALIGLLFVVVSLTSRMDRSSALRGVRVYMSPLLCTLALVLVMSGLAMVPELSRQEAAVVTTAAAVIGLAYGIFVVFLFRNLNMPEPTHWSDPWWYGLGPMVIYAALGGVAAVMWTDLEWAARALAAVLMASMILSIRNAWDLITWIAPHPDDTPPPDQP
ncbi:MAG: hypothetical protein JWO33_2863 [Caulobacteraceae bacterium]|nr:hypothetical protein [Caulobacteraceae bacterium]